MGRSAMSQRRPTTHSSEPVQEAAAGKPGSCFEVAQGHFNIGGPGPEA
jgi:hypothetical protein